MSLTNETKHDAVSPIIPVAPYMGGKSRLAKTIITRINDTDHNAYCEPFVGMGGVFFRRNMRPKAEFINDYNGEVHNLFLILREHKTELLGLLHCQITSRIEFGRLLNQNPSSLTDLQRAARFIYLQKTAFGGKISRQSFGTSKERSGFFNVTKLVRLIERAGKRLSGVTLERLSFEEFMPRYDSAGTLFYIDPPYYTNENDYGKDLFKRSDFEVLNELLTTLKGRFILSLNDRPEVRQIFKSFDIESVNVTYTIAAKNNKKFGEVLISN